MITLGFSLGIPAHAGGDDFQTSSEGPRLKPGVINQLIIVQKYQVFTFTKIGTISFLRKNSFSHVAYKYQSTCSLGYQIS